MISWMFGGYLLLLVLAFSRNFRLKDLLHVKCYNIIIYKTQATSHTVNTTITQMTAPARTPENNDGDNVVDTATTNSETVENNIRNNNDLQLSGDSNSNSNSNYISCRTVVGEGMNRFSAFINDNFIAARYGVFASIALLTAYGISNTPLFFRYRSVAEIPKSYFIGRRRLYCRIIGVHRVGDTNNASSKLMTGKNNSNSIEITVRNLSPIGLLLPVSWFEFLMKISPSKIKQKNNNNHNNNNNNNIPGEESNNELLRVKIAGIATPPSVSRDSSYNPEQFLKQLAKNRALVSCQLLGREVPRPVLDGERARVEDTTNPSPNKRQLSSSSSLSSLSSSSDLASKNDNNTNNIPTILDDYDDNSNQHQVAVVRLKYRPNWQLFSTDIAETLIKAGNCLPYISSSSSSQDNGNNMKIIDTSKRIQDIRNDVKYLDRLTMFEFQAAQKKIGIWSLPEIREMKKDVIDEIDFQAKATLLQKLWRMIRGG